MKVKDLVQVTAKNAFLQFPIDSERYELTAVLRKLATALDRDRYFDIPGIKDEKIRDFVYTAYSAFFLAAQSYWVVYRFGEDSQFVNSVMKERSRRIPLATQDYVRENNFLMLSSLEDTTREVCAHMMEALWHVLRSPAQADDRLH
jgi:hypothetical protein